MTRLLTVSLLAVFLAACTDAGLSPDEGYVEVEGGRVSSGIKLSAPATRHR